MKPKPSVSVNSTMKRVGRAVEFLAWAVFFALAALVLALRFWLLPDIERYRGEIVAAASRAVGQPVSIGGVDADWLGLHPRINLSDVRIHDAAGREVLALPRVENMLSWRALALGRVRLHSMVIEGLRLQVRRDAQGALHVAGMQLAGGGSGFSDWVLAQDEFVLRGAAIEWHDEQRGAPPLALSGLNLRLRNSGEEHAIGLTAQPPAGLGSSIELRALLRGRSFGELASWSGRLYAELGYTELGAWRPWVDYPWRVDQGEGALRLWLTLQGGELKRATADVSLADVIASLGEGLAPLRLASVVSKLPLMPAKPGSAPEGSAASPAKRPLAVKRAGASSGPLQSERTPASRPRGASSASRRRASPGSGSEAASCASGSSSTVSAAKAPPVPGFQRAWKSAGAIAWPSGVSSARPRAASS